MYSGLGGGKRLVLVKRWTCLEVEVLAGCFQMASEPVIVKDISIILLSPQYLNELVSTIDR